MTGQSCFDVGVGAGVIGDAELQAEVAADEEEAVEGGVIAPGPGEADQGGAGKDAGGEEPLAAVASPPEFKSYLAAQAIEAFVAARSDGQQNGPDREGQEEEEDPGRQAENHAFRFGYRLCCAMIASRLGH